jgi:predicted CXXCH cytochrome family protein
VSSVSQVCRTCHAGNGELFDGSNHKDAFEKHGWPECATCHGNHAVARTDDSMLSEESSPLCYECHREYADQNKQCIATAKYFYASITSLATESDSLGEQMHVLAEKGLDIDPLSSALEELDDSLRQLRSRIHSFEKSEFEDVETPGREVVEKGWRLVADAEAEHRYRRNGLIASLVVMVLLVVVIYLKLREIESHD